MKRIHIHRQRATRWQIFKAHMLENLLTRRKIGTAIMALIAYILSFWCSWYVALIPIYLNVAWFLLTYTLFLKRRESNNVIWDKYAEKYGNKKGKIPKEVLLRHSRMIKEGKQITL